MLKKIVGITATDFMGCAVHFADKGAEFDILMHVVFFSKLYLKKDLMESLKYVYGEFMRNA